MSICEKCGVDRRFRSIARRYYSEKIEALERKLEAQKEANKRLANRNKKQKYMLRKLWRSE